jgi:hypothetical protein
MRLTQITTVCLIKSELSTQNPHRTFVQPKQKVRMSCNVFIFMLHAFYILLREFGDCNLKFSMLWNRSLSLVTRLRDRRPKSQSSILSRSKKFLLSRISILAPGTTPLPVQYGPGDASSGVKRPGREANHSLHLVQKFRMGKL